MMVASGTRANSATFFLWIFLQQGKFSRLLKSGKMEKKSKQIATNIATPWVEK
jgi:hypothetical protein